MDRPDSLSSEAVVFLLDGVRQLVSLCLTHFSAVHAVLIATVHAHSASSAHKSHYEPDRGQTKILEQLRKARVQLLSRREITLSFRTEFASDRI